MKEQEVMDLAVKYGFSRAAARRDGVQLRFEEAAE